MENVIPIVLGLKTLLEEKRSPVLGNLMRYLQVRKKQIMLKWH